MSPKACPRPDGPLGKVKIISWSAVKRPLHIWNVTLLSQVVFSWFKIFCIPKCNLVQFLLVRTASVMHLFRSMMKLTALICLFLASPGRGRKFRLNNFIMSLSLRPPLPPPLSLSLSLGSAAVTVSLFLSLQCRKCCQLGMEYGLWKTGFTRFLELDKTRNRFWSSKNVVLCFGNTKTVHFGPKTRYSEIRFSQSPLFAPSLLPTRYLLLRKSINCRCRRLRRHMTASQLGCSHKFHIFNFSPWW